jgi:hypothetical protein
MKLAACFSESYGQFPLRVLLQPSLSYGECHALELKLADWQEHGGGQEGLEAISKKSFRPVSALSPCLKSSTYLSMPAG